MKRISHKQEIGILLLLFVISRLLLSYAGVSLDYSALYKNWQYLDTETLRHDLFNGIWYDHTQPPLFNLFLGLVLKIAGNQAPLVFAGILKSLTVVNTLLLHSILKKKLPGASLPFWIAVIYLLSPATMIFEHELFYTSVLSCLLLLAARAATAFEDQIGKGSAFLFFLPLVMASLTRSMYHIFWLAFICLLACLYFRGRKGSRILITGSLISVLLTGFWYYKNYVLYGKFTSSTWTGMNMARNVFHDAMSMDPLQISSIEPFSRISAYARFRSDSGDRRFSGLADRVLLSEMKNDSFINEKHIGYISISDQYAAACRQAIRTRPLSYMKNVVQSAIAFFAPATRYPTTEFQAKKLKYYDLLYSFNVTQLAEGKQQRRIALTVSAIPKALFYLFVFGSLLIPAIRTRKMPFLQLLIISTILYLFAVSSLFEHYENMRFRYEAEPLFLILAGIVLARLAGRKQQKPA